MSKLEIEEASMYPRNSVVLIVLVLTIFCGGCDLFKKSSGETISQLDEQEAHKIVDQFTKLRDTAGVPPVVIKRDDRDSSVGYVIKFGKILDSVTVAGHTPVDMYEYRVEIVNKNSGKVLVYFVKREGGSVETGRLVFSNLMTAIFPSSKEDWNSIYSEQVDPIKPSDNLDLANTSGSLRSHFPNSKYYSDKHEVYFQLF